MNLNLDGVDLTILSDVERYKHYAAVTVELNKRQLAQIEGNYTKEVSNEMNDDIKSNNKNKFIGKKRSGTYAEIQQDKPVKFSIVNTNIKKCIIDENAIEKNVERQYVIYNGGVNLSDSAKFNELVELVPIYRSLFTRNELDEINKCIPEALAVAVNRLECTYRVFYADL